MTPHIKRLLAKADEVQGYNSWLVYNLAQVIRELLEAQFIDQRNNPRPKTEHRGRKKKPAGPKGMNE